MKSVLIRHAAALVTLAIAMLTATASFGRKGSSVVLTVFALALALHWMTSD